MLQCSQAVPIYISHSYQRITTHTRTTCTKHTTLALWQDIGLGYQAVIYIMACLNCIPNASTILKLFQLLQMSPRFRLLIIRTITKTTSI